MLAEKEVVSRRGWNVSEDYAGEYLSVFGDDPSGEWSDGQGLTKPFKKLSVFRPIDLTYTSQVQTMHT